MPSEKLNRISQNNDQPAVKILTEEKERKDGHEENISVSDCERLMNMIISHEKGLALVYTTLAWGGSITTLAKVINQEKETAQYAFDRPLTQRDLEVWVRTRHERISGYFAKTLRPRSASVPPRTLNKVSTLVLPYIKKYQSAEYLKRAPEARAAVGTLLLRTDISTQQTVQILNEAFGLLIDASYFNKARKKVSLDKDDKDFEKETRAIIASQFLDGSYDGLGLPAISEDTRSASETFLKPFIEKTQKKKYDALSFQAAFYDDPLAKAVAVIACMDTTIDAGDKTIASIVSALSNTRTSKKAMINLRSQPQVLSEMHRDFPEMMAHGTRLLPYLVYTCKKIKWNVRAGVNWKKTRDAALKRITLPGFVSILENISTQKSERNNFYYTAPFESKRMTSNGKSISLRGQTIIFKEPQTGVDLKTHVQRKKEYDTLLAAVYEEINLMKSGVTTALAHSLLSHGIRRLHLMIEEKGVLGQSVSPRKTVADIICTAQKSDSYGVWQNWKGMQTFMRKPEDST